MDPHREPAETSGGAPPLRRTVRSGFDEPREHRARPCVRCPWRRDADLTDFTDADMAMLRGADGRPGDEAPVDAPTVGCHRDQPGTTHAWRLCAGHLAVVGNSRLGIRFSAMVGGLPYTALTPGDDWPALYGSLSELEAARNAQLGRAAGRRPTDAQRVLLARIERGEVARVHHARAGWAIRLTTECSRGRGGGQGRKVDARVRELAAAGWAFEGDHDHRTGYIWRLGDTGRAHLTDTDTDR